MRNPPRAREGPPVERVAEQAVLPEELQVVRPEEPRVARPGEPQVVRPGELPEVLRVQVLPVQVLPVQLEQRPLEELQERLVRWREPLQDWVWLAL